MNYHTTIFKQHKKKKKKGNETQKKKTEKIYIIPKFLFQEMIFKKCLIRSEFPVMMTCFIHLLLFLLPINKAK